MFERGSVDGRIILVFSKMQSMLLPILWSGLLSTVPFNHGVNKLLSADTDVSLAVKCPMCEVISLETKKIRLLDFADFCRMTHYY